jgi:hypothetical protein
MVVVSSGILIVIFSVLAGLHLYWAAGGRWGIEHAAPVNERGKKFLNTGVAACLIVAAGLALFGAYYLILPSGMLAIMGWIIPFIFLIRAIGDFRYVGFSKKVKSSTFAELDTKFFSPLCLMIAALGITIKLFS